MSAISDEIVDGNLYNVVQLLVPQSSFNAQQDDDNDCHWKCYLWWPTNHVANNWIKHFRIELAHFDANVHHNIDAFWWSIEYLCEAGIKHCHATCTGTDYQTTTRTPRLSKCFEFVRFAQFWIKVNEREMENVKPRNSPENVTRMLFMGFLCGLRWSNANFSFVIIMRRWSTGQKKRTEIHEPMSLVLRHAGNSAMRCAPWKWCEWWIFSVVEFLWKTPQLWPIPILKQKIVFPPTANHSYVKTLKNIQTSRRHLRLLFIFIFNSSDRLSNDCQHRSWKFC